MGEGKGKGATLPQNLSGQILHRVLRYEITVTKHIISNKPQYIIHQAVRLYTEVEGR